MADVSSKAVEMEDSHCSSASRVANLVTGQSRNTAGGRLVSSGTGSPGSTSKNMGLEGEVKVDN